MDVKGCTTIAGVTEGESRVWVCLQGGVRGVGRAIFLQWNVLSGFDCRASFAPDIVQEGIVDRCKEESRPSLAFTCAFRAHMDTWTPHPALGFHF